MIKSYHDLVDFHGLIPHFEGGFYKETYRSKESLLLSQLPPRFSEHSTSVPHGTARHWSTGILYLLPFGQKSRLHRIKSDEMWHFYGGDPLTLYIIPPHSPTGPIPKLRKVVLGNDLIQDHHVQFVVEAGSWFGATPGLKSCDDVPGPCGYSFVGCTVSPGFDIADFEIANSSHFGNLDGYAENERVLRTLKQLIQEAPSTK